MMDITGPSGLAALPVALFSFTGQIGANGSQDLGTVMPSGSASTGIADLASYTGTGTLTYSATVSTTTSSSGGGGNVFTVQTTTAGTWASVTYIYSPPIVPSPTPVTPTPTETPAPTATATETATATATAPIAAPAETPTVVVAEKLPDTGGGSGMGTSPALLIATIAAFLAGAAGVVLRIRRESSRRI